MTYWVVGVVSMLVSAVVAGGCGSGLGTPPPTRVPGSTPWLSPSGATSSPASGLPSPGAGGALLQLADFPAEGAFEVTGAIATADGYLAVGFGAAEGEDYFDRRQGIIWRSSDGRHWQADRDPALINVTPIRIASLGLDLFLLGLLSACGEDDGAGCPEVPEAGYAIWRSAAGGPWQRQAPPPGMSGALSVDDLVAGWDRVVAFGSAADERETPTLWSSTDGVTWSQTTELAGLDPITALGATPNGYVAFGTVQRPDRESADLAAALSRDGITFSTALVPTQPNAAIDDVAVGDGGLVGVGRGYADDDIDLHALALFSADGDSWVAGSAADGSFLDAALVAAHAVDSGYAAIGFKLDDSDFAVQTGQAWISADGQRWRALATIGAVSLITASASGAAGLVVFSADQSEDETGVTSSVGAWFAPSSALVP